MTPSTNKRHSELLIFCRDYKTFRIFRDIEQLSGLVGWRIIAFKQNGQGYLLWDFICYAKFVF